MRKTTFFGITAIIVLLMVGYFALQLKSQPATWCRPFFDYECESYAQLTCAAQGGDYMDESLNGAICLGYSCYGYWAILCNSEARGFYLDDIWCEDSFCDDCYPN
jgi:hypothetical protein